jgi:cysteine desulfuration protein SufE
MPETVQKVLQRFQRLTDPKQKYEQLILYGQKVPALPETEKVPANRVAGCVSQVYITARLDADRRVIYAGDSDALISKGFVGLLITALSGLTPEEIAQVPEDFIQSTGLVASLTPSRTNGFYNILKTMQIKALELCVNS